MFFFKHLFSSSSVCGPHLIFFSYQTLDVIPNSSLLLHRQKVWVPPILCPLTVQNRFSNSSFFSTQKRRRKLCFFQKKKNCVVRRRKKKRQSREEKRWGLCFGLVLFSFQILAEKNVSNFYRGGFNFFCLHYAFISENINNSKFKS